MIRTIPDTTSATPLAETLQHATARIAYLSAGYGEPPAGWQMASEVVNNPDAVSDLLDHVCALYEMDNRQVAASFLILGYFWNPMLAALSCYAVDRRLPDLSATTVAFDVRGGVQFTSPRITALPDDPAAGQADVEIVPTLDALRDRLVQQLQNEHAEPLFETLRSVAPYGINGMRANYIDRLVSALLWIAESLDDQEFSRREVPAFVCRMSDKNRAGIIEVEHAGCCGVYQKRGGCCLSYRLPANEKCDTCSLRPMDERIAIFQARLENPEMQI